MTTGHAFTFAVMVNSLCAMLCASAFASPIVLNSGTYEITAETLMPNLEENLRYAISHHRQCLGTQDVTTLFPILRHETFTGCVLVDDQTLGEQAKFSLNCQNTEAATGTARLTVNPDSIYGVLKIKMGGKNMTFSQRIKGTRLGVCEVVQNNEYDRDKELERG